MSTLNVHNWKKQMNRIPAIYRKHVEIILNGLHNVPDNFKRYRTFEKIMKRGLSENGDFAVSYGFEVGSGGGTKKFSSKLSAAAQLCWWLDGLGHSPVFLGTPETIHLPSLY